MTLTPIFERVVIVLRTKNGIRVQVPGAKKKQKIINEVAFVSQERLNELYSVRNGICPKCNATLINSDNIPNTFYKIRMRCMHCKTKFNY